MLQELLNVGLVEIGSDDTRFNRMVSAAEALVEALKKDPRLLIPATLIAIDNDVEEKDPTFDLVEGLVIKKWKTLRNTHVNRPRELLRSIIIHAVAAISEASPEIAGVVWHTAFSPFSHGQKNLGKEKELLARLLRSTGETAEREAVARAHMEPAAKRRRRKKTVASADIKLQLPKLDESELTNDVASAAGPNPHLPPAGQQWCNEFAPKMTAAMVKAVNLGLNRQFESLSTALTEYRNALELQLADHFKRINAIRADFSQAQQASQVRLDVLWWTQAKYSPSLRCGYRELSAIAAAMTMAHDLASLVPALAPASITHVLGETISALLPPSSKAKKHTVKSLLESLAAGRADLGDLCFEVENNQSRLQLIELAYEATRGVVKTEDLGKRAGLKSSLKLTIQQFAMWIFRDLQARRLIEEIK